HRFLKAYIQHRPHFQPVTPGSAASPGPAASISTFMLDNRVGAGAAASSYAEEEAQRDEDAEREIRRLMHETRLWRVANSAQWVAWGIVQAKVEGMDEALAAANNPTFNSLVSSASASTSAPASHLAPDGPEKHEEKAEVGKEEQKKKEEEEGEGEEEEAEEFDYLGYAQDRAMFFWGDVLGLGLVRPDELPPGLLAQVKVVGY
ncbi:MAG: hypothetical protein Q9187_009673, partial [Circinaria calcarea]